MTHAFWSVLTLSVMLSACSSEDYRIPSQKWNEVILRVESRPTPIQPGMNEFLIIANDAQGGPAHDLTVTLQIKGEPGQTQAIQDGMTGVYRRALKVRKIENAILEVHMKRNQADGQLDFQLTKQ